MPETLSVVTRKGQITIPVKMRRALGLTEGDKVAIVLDDDEVRIRRGGSVTERTAGALKGTEAYESAERLRKIAEEVIRRGEF